MKREIIITGDGSKTIHIPEWNEQYHSKHGAIQEAKHVYLKHGLAFFIATEGNEISKIVSILEIGFGTGLNAFLSAIEAEKLKIQINYTGVEAFPIASEELKQLNYTEDLKNQEVFNKLHSCDWEKEFEVSENFQLKKQKKKFKDIDENNTFDVIYFDAFGPRVQPELWTESIFKIMHKALKTNGVLVTYCAQGHARRAMIASGFKVDRVEGPPGKRHMLRAIKL